MDRYERELENLKGNYFYGDIELDKSKFKPKQKVKITKKLFDQASFLLFEKQHGSDPDESKKMIKKFKEDIQGGTADFPAIALVKHKGYDFIADGNHRVCALFEEGVKEWPALYIKRKD